MSNAVKILCTLSAIVLMFTGCAFVSENETESTTATTTLLNEIVTERVTEETTVSSDSGYLNVSNSDLDTLRNMLCGYHYKNYDVSVAAESDLVALLTDGYVCQGLMSVAKSLTSFPEDAFSGYAVMDEADPMGVFEGSYVWIREDMFDFISQDIFGVPFAHEFDEGKESNSVYYYFDGYFYFSCMVTGLEAEDILINDCIRQPDGRYLIKTELTGGNLEFDGEIYHKSYGDITAGIVEENGIRHWEISKIEVY